MQKFFNYRLLRALEFAAARSGLDGDVAAAAGSAVTGTANIVGLLKLLELFMALSGGGPNNGPAPGLLSGAAWLAGVATGGFDLGGSRRDPCRASGKITGQTGGLMINASGGAGCRGSKACGGGTMGDAWRDIGGKSWTTGGANVGANGGADDGAIGGADGCANVGANAGAIGAAELLGGASIGSFAGKG